MWRPSITGNTILAASLITTIVTVSPAPLQAEEASSSSETIEPVGSDSTTRSRIHRTEWIIDGVLGGVWLALLPFALREPRTDARIGPVFRGPEDLDALTAADEAGTIGRPWVEEETVSDGAMLLGSGLALLGALAVGYGLAPLFDLDAETEAGWTTGRWYGEQALSFFVGAIQTMLGTILMTEVAKNNAGRLRPDFADRADRFYCYQNPIPELYRPRCSMLESRGDLGPQVDAAIVRRGRRSFWSGHAAISMSSMTYAALYLGGRMVWGRTANTLTRTIGIAGQGALLAAALFISTSRLSDGVHHAEDVWVGAAVGFAMAQLGYWLHFDGRGEVRRGASLQVNVAPVEGGATAGVVGVF